MTIRPDVLQKRGAAPKAVRQAYLSWTWFVTMSTQPVYEGIGVIRISHELLGRDFLKRVLINGGTDRDILWLIQEGVISDNDRAVWESVVEEYAIEELEDAE